MPTFSEYVAGLTAGTKASGDASPFVKAGVVLKQDDSSQYATVAGLADANASRLALARKATAGASLGTMLAWDTFDRADGALVGSTADSGQTWAGSAGAWNISGNRLGTAGGLRSVWVDTGQSDVQTDVTVLKTISGNLNISPAVCMIDVDNLIYLHVGAPSGTDASIRKLDGGSVTTLATFDITSRAAAGRSARLAIRKAGDVILAYHEGSLIGTHTLSAGDISKYGSITKQGLRLTGTSAVAADDFTVRL